MRDNKWIIDILGYKYAVQRTFGNDPAIYISIGGKDNKNRFCHINDLNHQGSYETRIESICIGMHIDEGVIIFAHLELDVRDKSKFICNSKTGDLIRVEIDGESYCIDLNPDGEPAIYVSTDPGEGMCIYHLKEYVGYCRQLISPRDLLRRMGDKSDQVVIMANMVD